MNVPRTEALIGKMGPISTITCMSLAKTTDLEFAYVRLPTVSPVDLIAHMSDPRVAEHMPLLTSRWDEDTVATFVAGKERYWHRDNLGHWAILCNGRYVGWGGFQREGGEWDYALVLKPEFFGLGIQISRQAMAFARADERIDYVTFLLAPTRKNLRALGRLGASFLGEVEYEGARFLKYVLRTT